MLAKLSLSLLCAGALFSTSTLAMNHSLSPGVSLEYEFLPNQPELLTNYTIFNISATCTIQTGGSNQIIHVRGINRSGTINGIELEKGKEIDILVNNNDQMVLTAQRAAQVEFTNMSDLPIKALCKT